MYPISLSKISSRAIASALSKFSKENEESGLDPNRIALLPSAYATLEKEMLGAVGTGAELAIDNPQSGTRVIVTKWTTGVQAMGGTLWFQEA